jgi:SnoaL-like domain
VVDPPESVSDETAWRVAAAYIDAWNERDRDAWLELLHPELEFRPTAIVGSRIVYHGIDGAARYFDELVASERPERAEVRGLRRVAPDRFVLELELFIDRRSVSTACVVAQLRDGKFVDTAGYLSDAQTLASTGVIPEDVPAIPRPGGD